MNIQIKIQDAAQRALTRFYKDDPQGTEQVIDSINLLRDNRMGSGRGGPTWAVSGVVAAQQWRRIRDSNS